MIRSALVELMVQRLLKEQEMYGYEIVQAIAMRTCHWKSPTDAAGAVFHAV